MQATGCELVFVLVASSHYLPRCVQSCKQTALNWWRVTCVSMTYRIPTITITKLVMEKHFRKINLLNMAKRFWCSHKVVFLTYPYGGRSQKCHGNTFFMHEKWKWHVLFGRRWSRIILWKIVILASDFRQELQEFRQVRQHFTGIIAHVLYHENTLSKIEKSFFFYENEWKHSWGKGTFASPPTSRALRGPLKCRTGVDRHFTSWQEPQHKSLTASHQTTVIRTALSLFPLIVL